jgi:DNA polymerase-3 subunit gamma/tau
MRFEDLIGQDHVARTLSNAIESGRVAHAFLFTGVRGVGKTTSARILAKALNCMREAQAAPAGVDPGPTVSPCLSCPACLEIAQGNDMDVREIDGASYNGVDEVRKLQDTLPYRPSRDRYKIFIVDEVHMLSQNAWNAFLKTLEEPPPHVKFIFATTEVHKVPITILSRVQRFDFKLISTRQIAERLRYVLGQEGVGSDEQAVSIIAREAAGSMRDAMSLLDQVIAWGGAELRGEDVARVLGVASRQVLHELSAALVSGDASRCLSVVSELANQGYDMAHVARDILALLRDLVVAKVCDDPQAMLDLADEEQRDVITLAQSSESDDLLRLHQGFSKSFDDVVKSGQPRAALEMLLVRLARRPPLLPIDDLCARLAALERRLGGSATRAPEAARPVGPPPSPGRDVRSVDTRPRPRDARAQSAPKPSSDPDRREEPPAAPNRQENAPVRVATTPESRPASPAPGPPSAPRAAVENLDAWRAIVGLVRENRPELAAFLEHTSPLTVKPGELRIALEPGSMFEKEVSDKASLAILGRAASTHFNTETAVSVEFDSAQARQVTTLSALEVEAREQRTRAAILRAKQHPRVTDAVEILGARLKDLKLLE